MNRSLLVNLLVLAIWAGNTTALGDTFEKRVGHNNDDAEEDDGGGISRNNDKMELGQMKWVGFRFLDVTIPQGATITNAYVEFKAADSNTEGTDLTIFGQDADSTSRFNNSDDDLSDRPRTSASVDWSNIPNWSMNQLYQTPDITTVIQEIVDRGGWSSGSSMVVLVRSDDLDGKRLVVAHDDSSSNAAELHIEYSGGGGGGGWPTGSAQNVDIAVSDKIEVKDDGVIRAAQGDVVVSTNSTSDNRIKVKNDGRIEGDAYVGAGGDPNDGIDLRNNGVITGAMGELDVAVVIPSPSAPNLGSSVGNRTYSSGTTTLSSHLHCHDLTIRNSAILEISGDVIILVDDDLKIEDDAEVRILPGGTLTVYSNDKFDIQNDARVNVDGADPSRLTINHLDSRHVHLKNNAIMYATVIASDTTFHLKNASRFFGTFKGKKVEVEDDAQLYVLEGAVSTPLFTDVTASLGFEAQTTSGTIYGSGFCWADFDNDGDLDAIITGDTAKLILNNGAGQGFFASSLGGFPGQGALVDLDNDGDVDFWTGSGACLVNGSAAFSNQGNQGFSEPSNNEGAAAADVNGDGWCDIVHFSQNGNWIGHHQGFTTIVLAGSNETSYGLNDSGDAGNGDYCSAGDVNNDGYLDFFYHYGGGKLFLSNGDGTYTQNNYGISVATGENDKMGSAWGDYDNDGDIDLFVARYASGQPGYLWRNDGGSFSDVASAAGITDTSGQRGCCWGDYDNDGDLDLYIVTHSSNANVLYQNQGGGSFVAVNEGADASGDGHDAVFVDYDNDGDLDLAVSQQGEDNTLLANGADDTNYLKVRVIGHGVAMTNRAGVGVRVELYESNGTTFLARRHIGVARGFAGAEPLWIHFGGVTNTATYVVKVHFASGIEAVTVVPQDATTTIGSTLIDQMLTVQERKPRILRWTEVDPLDQ